MKYTVCLVYIVCDLILSANCFYNLKLIASSGYVVDKLM